MAESSSIDHWKLLKRNDLNKLAKKIGVIGKDDPVKTKPPEIMHDVVIAAEADVHLAYLFASPRFLKIEAPPYEEPYTQIEHRE